MDELKLTVAEINDLIVVLKLGLRRISLKQAIFDFLKVVLFLIAVYRDLVDNIEESHILFQFPSFFIKNERLNLYDTHARIIYGLLERYGFRCLTHSAKVYAFS